MNVRGLWRRLQRLEGKPAEQTGADDEYSRQWWEARATPESRIIADHLFERMDAELAARGIVTEPTPRQRHEIFASSPELRDLSHLQYEAMGGGMACPGMASCVHTRMRELGLSIPPEASDHGQNGQSSSQYGLKELDGNAGNQGGNGHANGR